METTETKVPDQPTNSVQTPFPNQPIQNSDPMAASNQKQKLFLILGVIILLVIFSGCAYYLGSQQGKSINPITQTAQITPTIAVATEPPPATAIKSSPTANVTWKTQAITLQYESEFTGELTLNMELKIPDGWTLQTYPRQTDPNNMIKKCSDYVIASPTVGLLMTLSPLCSGWSNKYSSWPTDAVIALQQKREGTAGQYNYYRVRYITTTDNYNYVDFMPDTDHPLDKNKDQVMDAILIGYAPPNESTNDFFYIAAHLTSIYHLAAGERDKYLSIADQIAASITLR